MGTIGGESATGAPATQSVSLRPACQADASAIAALHANSITEGFLSSLGERFLRRLYRRMMASRQSVVLVAQGPEAVVGFVAGSLEVSK
ncbi:MAG TPA: hypothetical protein VK386_08915, partial [Acidimicrobiales bacterium]|nr:hypothetical protein [Acidimicrobiales bacterium]